MKKISTFLFPLALGAALCFSACAKPSEPNDSEIDPPFSLNFTGVAGAYDEAQNRLATLLFSGAEAHAGEITLTTDESPTFPFVYTISNDGMITFDFEAEEGVTAQGSLHGYRLDATATIQGKSYNFLGTYYEFTEKMVTKEMDDGEITEQGYITAGYPLNDAASNVEELDTITMNGKTVTYAEFQAAKMPEEALELVVSKPIPDCTYPEIVD